LRHKWLRFGRHHTAKSRRLVPNFVTTTPWRIARRVCQLGGEGCLRPCVPCPTKQNLARRTSGGSICGFKRHSPGEPCDYRRGPQTATAQKIPSAGNAKLPVRKGERSTRCGIQEVLSWGSPAVRQVP